MGSTLETLGRLLRGDVTRAEGLREGRLDIEERALLLACVALGAAYGLFMGIYAAIRGGPGSTLRILATIVQVPLLFLLAVLGGQMTLGRHYRSLIARNPLHRWGRVAWLSVYVFVAIQMAWMLRPFVGEPTLVTRFIRGGELGNAYVEVAGIVWRLFLALTK